MNKTQFVSSVWTKLQMANLIHRMDLFIPEEVTIFEQVIVPRTIPAVRPLLTLILRLTPLTVILEVIRTLQQEDKIMGYHPIRLFLSLYWDRHDDTVYVRSVYAIIFDQIYKIYDSKQNQTQLDNFQVIFLTHFDGNFYFFNIGILL